MIKLKRGLLLFCSLLLLNFTGISKAYAAAISVRLGGADRYDTAVQISNDGFQQSDYVVIVSGNNFPDALSATPLAKKYNAPILPVSGQSLNSNIENEILRLGAKYAFIIGGTGAVSEGIENQLDGLNITTNRIAGADRYETSSKIAQFIGTSNGVVVASGENFPDALSIASIAGFKQMPILLTTANALPQSIQDFINNNTINQFYVIGGTGVISNSAVSGLKNYTRLSGSDRYGTNLAVLNQFKSDLNFSTVYVTTGENFPDALSGSVDAAKTSSPVILASNRYYAASDLIKGELNNITQFKILGGIGALSDLAVQQIMQGEPIASKIVFGYATNYNDSDSASPSYSSISNNLSSINEIATVTFDADSSGNLTGSIPYNQLALAKNNNIKTLALVTNSFDKDIAKSILESPSTRQNLINNILNEIESNNYDGVNIDFEDLYYYDRSYFTTFMSELYSALHAQNLMVTVSVPAETGDSLTDSWTGAFDYSAIANYADQIEIMTYDQHYQGGPAGPIASIGWVQNVVNYALSKIPNDKILLGVAAYGYDWSSNGTTAYTLNQINNLVSRYGAQVQWDSASESPYFNYTDSSGVKHTVWFENSTSLGYKLDLVNNSNLAGIAIWSLGSEDSSYWSTIADKFN